MKSEQERANFSFIIVRFSLGSTDCAPSVIPAEAGIQSTGHHQVPERSAVLVRGLGPRFRGDDVKEAQRRVTHRLISKPKLAPSTRGTLILIPDKSMDYSQVHRQLRVQISLNRYLSLDD